MGEWLLGKADDRTQPEYRAIVQMRGDQTLRRSAGIGCPHTEQLGRAKHALVVVDHMT